jgi:hypothetical protein
VNLPDYFLIRVRSLFFPNIPLLLFSVIRPALGASSLRLGSIHVTETFSTSFKTSLLIRFPNPFLRKESDQFPILYKNLDLSTERHAIFCQMPMISMVFTELTPISLEWVGLHLLWPSECWIPLNGREHLGEAGVQRGEDFLLKSQWLCLPRLTFE